MHQSDGKSLIRPTVPTDQSSAPNAAMSPSVYCSTASHHHEFKDNSEQELTSEDPSIHSNIRFEKDLYHY